MLPERPSAALAGLDKEVSDGSTIVSCWSESPPAEQSPGLDTCPVEALGERLLPLIRWARSPGLQTPVLCAVVTPEEKWSLGLFRKKENVARED